MAKTRKQLIDSVRRWVRETRIDLDMEAHWNRLHPDQPPVNVFDPDGRILRMVEDAERMLAADPGHGPIAKITYEIAPEPARVQ